MFDGSAAPTVSVVVPTFNRRAALAGALASIEAQTLTSHEVIVVDDASDPSQRPDVQALTAEGLRVVARVSNGGVAAAQNSGLFVAQGEFVAFLHTDDRWYPDKLRNQVSALRSTPTALGVESSTMRRRPSGDVLAPARLKGRSVQDVMRREVKDLHISGFLFRRDALLSIDGFDDQLRSYEDLDLIIRLLRVGAVVITDDVVSCVDQCGTDRLALSPWMQRGRATLIRKYQDELISEFFELPAEWRNWAKQIAVDALAKGDTTGAKFYLELARGGRPLSRAAMALLYASSRSGARGAKMSARCYSALAQLSKSWGGARRTTSAMTRS